MRAVLRRSVEEGREGTTSARAPYKFIAPYFGNDNTAEKHRLRTLLHEDTWCTCFSRPIILRRRVTYNYVHLAWKCRRIGTYVNNYLPLVEITAEMERNQLVHLFEISPAHL